MEHNTEIDSVVIERIFATPFDEPGEDYIDISATVRPCIDEKPEARFVVVSTPTDDDGVLMDLGDVISGTWTPTFARAVAAALVRAAGAADAASSAAVLNPTARDTSAELPHP
jgi:glycine cleavage system aminomethyltransferase T